MPRTISAADHLIRPTNAPDFRLGLLAGYAVLSGLLGALLIGPALGVVPGCSLSLAGTLLTVAAMARRRHRPRAPQHAAQVAAAEASLAS